MAEHKYFDWEEQIDAANPCFSPLGKLVDLTPPAQGFADTQRIGDKCTGTSLQCAITTRYDPTGTANFRYQIRFVVFIWKDDTVPTLADILYIAPTGSNPAVVVNPWPHQYTYNHDRKVKRRILYDKVYDGATYYNVNDVTAVWNMPKSYKFSIPLGKYERDAIINFNAATTVGVNKIYMLVVSNSVAAPQEWETRVRTRYNYVDC